MLFADLARTSERVAAVSARTAKRHLLADTIAAAAPDELPLVVCYLGGALRQRRTNLGWASLPDVPPAASPTLTVREVDEAFERIAAESGSGSAARRTLAAHTLFGRAIPAEQAFLRGLIAGEVRQGALDSLVQDALAAAFAVPPVAVRRAAMLLGSTTAAADLVRAGGSAALDAVRLRVGQPVLPMLAAASPDTAGAVARTGLPALVDAKLDGIRVQVHRSGREVAVFTRSLEDITGRVPELVAAVAALPVHAVVLDGEAIALDAAGRPRPFQVTAARAAERPPTGAAGPGRAARAVRAGRPAVALSLRCFDVLHVDGDDLLDAPLLDRDAVLRSRVPAGLVVPRIRAGSADAAAAFFADVVADGFEGIVVKRTDAPYAAGRRDPAWIKVKPRHTFDLAVTAAEWGYGRRTGFLSNLHLAARDADTGALVMLGKTFKGLTDAMLAWQTEQIRARASRSTRTTVYADPPLVAEIACDGLQVSRRYPGGVALRFARVVRYRTDKSPEEVDTIDTVRALAPLDGGG